MPEIRLEHVTKRFEKFVAVDDLNLHIDEHDFITLLGPSETGSLIHYSSLGYMIPVEYRLAHGAG